MNQDQNNHYVMYKGVSNFFSQNASVWSANGVVSNLVGQLNNNISDVADADTAQLHDTTGSTADKHMARTLLIGILVKNAAAGYGYAATTGNNTLKDACRMNASALGRLSPGDLFATAQDLYNTLNPFITNLAGWGIGPADLSAQQSAANAFNSSIGPPITARAITRAATLSLPVLISNTNDLLNDQLDAAMVQYETSNPAFYAQYRVARKLPSAGASHHYGVIHCTALNSSGAAIPDTRFVIAGITRAKKKAKNGKGNYTRIHTPVSVTVTATAPGMLPVSHTLTLNANGAYTLSFILQPATIQPGGTIDTPLAG